MKIALMKIGSRIANNKRLDNVAMQEIFSIANTLTYTDNTVDIFSFVSEKDDPYKNIVFKDLRNEFPKKENYDCIIVLNGTANFFSGQENELQILTYNAISQFDGTVFYIITDANLLFRQIDTFVDSKEWGQKYKDKNLSIQSNKVYCIFQYSDSKQIQNNIQSFVNAKNGKTVDCIDTISFPFQHFLLFSDAKCNLSFNENFDIDLIYLGYNKPKRIPTLVKYFFDLPNDIKAEISFGKNNLKQFESYQYETSPTFIKQVKYREYFKQLQKSLSTVIIGDVQCKYDGIAARVYESIGINIVFIDKMYDPNFKIFKHDKLREFCYIDNKNDLIKRIRYLKQNTHIIKKIINLQVEDTKICKDEYAKRLHTIIKERINV